MAETPKKASPSAKTAATGATPASEAAGNGSDPMDAMMAYNGAAMEAFSQACESYASGFTALNEEFMSFFKLRMQHDVDLGRELSKCSTWADAASLQQDWAQTASQEYFEEANRLMQMATKMASDSWQPLADQAEQAVEALPLRKAG